MRSETPSGVVVEPAGTSLRLSSSFFLDRVPKRKFVYFQPPSRQNRLFVVLHYFLQSPFRFFGGQF